MARVAQEGKMLVWTVMSAPSQRQQHYQAIRDVQHHTVLPITKSVILGNFDRHRIMMGTLNDGSPITLHCITTTDPREAHYIECALAKQGLNMDCLVSRGKNELVFVIFPSYSDANPVVKFFAGSGNNWAWIPTAERAGFILRPPFLFPDTDTNTLRLGADTIHSTVLIQEFFGRINTSPTVHDAYTLYD